MRRRRQGGHGRGQRHARPTRPENLNPIAGDTVYEGNLKFFNGLLRYDKDLNERIADDRRRSRRRLGLTLQP